jgi:hypothetical protein
VATLRRRALQLGRAEGKVARELVATGADRARPRCRTLKDRVWEAFKGNPDFVMISISRKKMPPRWRRSWPSARCPDHRSDTDCTAYARYAEAYIPRNHVIGRDGRIVFQSEGFAEAEFAAMITATADALAAR